MCSKYLPLECVHALSSIRHWLMDVSMTSCSMLLQMFSRHCCSSSTFRIFELLHCSPDLVIHRVKIWIVRWPLFWWNKVRRVSRYLPNKWQYLTNTSKNSGKGKAICSKCVIKNVQGNLSIDSYENYLCHVYTTKISTTPAVVFTLLTLETWLVFETRVLLARIPSSLFNWIFNKYDT